VIVLRSTHQLVHCEICHFLLKHLRSIWILLRSVKSNDPIFIFNFDVNKTRSNKPIDKNFLILITFQLHR